MKTCLECDGKIVGREDKKFCSDTCRSAYHNNINQQSSRLMRTVNYRLRRNYQILSELNPKGETITLRSDLLKKGFDFEHFTSFSKTKKGKTYYFLYDQGYAFLADDAFKLIKKQT